jgi:predicted RND superfamily exporter protein
MVKMAFKEFEDVLKLLIWLITIVLVIWIWTFIKDIFSFLPIPGFIVGIVFLLGVCISILWLKRKIGI